MSTTLNDLLRRKKIAQSGSSASGLTRAQRYSSISRNNFRRLPPSIEKFPTPNQNTTVLLNGQDIQTVNTRSTYETITGNKEYIGDVKFNTFSVNNSAILNGEVILNNNVTLNGNMNVTGVLLINELELQSNSNDDKIDVSSQMNFRKPIISNEKTTINGVLDVSATGTFSGENTFTGENTFSSDTFFTGTTSIDNLISNNEATFNDGLKITNGTKKLTINTDINSSNYSSNTTKGHFFKEQVNCGGKNPNSAVDLYINHNFQVREKFTDSGYIFNTYNNFGNPYGELLVIGDKDDPTGIAFFQHDKTKTTTIDSNDGNFNIKVGNVNGNGAGSYETKFYMDNSGRVLLSKDGTSISDNSRFIVENEDYVKAIFRDTGGSGGGSAIRVENNGGNYWDMAIGQNNKFALNYNKDSFGELFLLDSSGKLQIGNTENEKFILTPSSDHIEYNSTNGNHFIHKKIIVGEEIPEDRFDTSYNINVNGAINANQIFLDKTNIRELFLSSVSESASDIVAGNGFIAIQVNTNNEESPSYQKAGILGDDQSGNQNKIILMDESKDMTLATETASGDIIFQTDSTDRMRITSDGLIELTGTSLLNHSDERLKTDIQNINQKQSLKIIDNINPRTYKYKSSQSSRTEFGFIAQEIKQNIPDAVSIRYETMPINEIKIDNYSFIQHDNISRLRINKTDKIDKIPNLKERDILTIQIKDNEQHIQYEPRINEEYPFRWLNISNDIQQLLNTNTPFIIKGKYIDLHYLDYKPLWTILTSAVKELSYKEESSREEINKLKEENKELHNKINKLTEYVYSLSSS